jgi:alkylated DNA repair dioxygenase AlkB
MSPSPDRDLFGPTPGAPEGFVYRPHFIDAAEEAALIAQIETLPFKPFEFRGYQGARRVVSFGWRYDFGDRRMHQAAAIPELLVPLRDRAAAFAGLPRDAFVHALVTEYAPGAPIGWHRDRPQFDDVVGVSLGSPCTFRFRRKAGLKWERYSFVAEPRSAYLLRGPARTEWEHSIPAVERLRYSVTFRSLRGEPHVA